MIERKITRRTIAWLVVFAVAIGVNAWLWLSEARRADHERHSNHGSVALFARGFDRITAIEVHYKGRRARFGRKGKADWFFRNHTHAHEPGRSRHRHSEVDNERITKALEMFGRIKSDRRIAENLPKSDLYGVNRAELVAIAFADEHKAPVLTLNFGDLGPDGLSRYVFVRQTGAIELVPNFHAENLRKLMAQILMDAS